MRNDAKKGKWEGRRVGDRRTGNQGEGSGKGGDKRTGIEGLVKTGKDLWVRNEETGFRERTWGRKFEKEDGERAQSWSTGHPRGETQDEPKRAEISTKRKNIREKREKGKSVSSRKVSFYRGGKRAAPRGPPKRPTSGE